MLSIGVILLILGIGSFILPMFHMQFKLITFFGPTGQPIAACIAAAVGAILIIVSIVKKMLQDRELKAPVPK